MGTSDTVFYIIKHYFNESAINLKTHLIDDLGADSLDIVEVIMQVEEEFKIEIPDEEASGLSTIGDIVWYVKINKKVI